MGMVQANVQLGNRQSGQNADTFLKETMKGLSQLREKVELGGGPHWLIMETSMETPTVPIMSVNKALHHFYQVKLLIQNGL